MKDTYEDVSIFQDVIQFKAENGEFYRAQFLKGLGKESEWKIHKYEATRYAWIFQKNIVICLSGIPEKLWPLAIYNKI